MRLSRSCAGGASDEAIARKQFVALTLAAKGDSVVDGGTVGTTTIRFVGASTSYSSGAWSITGSTTALSSSKIVGVDFVDDRRLGCFSMRASARTTWRNCGIKLSRVAIHRGFKRTTCSENWPG